MNRNALFLLVSTLLGAEDLGQKISSRRTRIGVVNREKPIFWKWLMKTVILFFLSLKHTLSKYHFLINMIMYSFVSGYVSLIALGCNGTVLRRSSMIGQTGGKIESEGYFDNNNHFVRHGCSKHWNEEGTLIFRAKYTHDVVDEYESFWAHTKKYQTRYKYKNGNIQEAFFYDQNGKLIFHEYYKNGNGIDYGLFPDGKINWKVRVENGEKNGEMIFYDEDGNIQMKYMYEKGKK